MNMNTDQQFLVNNLQKMVKYIEAETKKKVEVIEKDAEREATLQKAKYIMPEKEKISKRMEKELEDYKTKMKIAQSQKLNKLRLEKLKVKIDCVNSVFEDARNSLLKKINGNQNEYKAILKSLIIQGLIRLLDEKITIICKEKDLSLVKSIKESAKNEFLDKLKKEAKKGIVLNKLEINIDEKHFLPDNIIGGIFMTSFGSKIRLDNTLDKRLELLRQTATPEIRTMLFGDEGAKKVL